MFTDQERIGSSLAHSTRRLEVFLNHSLTTLKLSASYLATPEQLIAKAGQNPALPIPAELFESAVPSQHRLEQAACVRTCVPLYINAKLAGVWCLHSTDPEPLLPKAIALSEQAQMLLELWLYAKQQECFERQRAFDTCLWQNSREALLHFTGDNQILAINPRLTTLLGYTEQQLSQLSLEQLLPNNWACERDTFIAHAALSPNSLPRLGWSARMHCLRANGSFIPVYVNVRQVAWPGQQGEHYIMFIRTRLQTEPQNQSIHEGAILKAIIDASPNAIYARDRDGNYLLANQASQNFIQPTLAGAVSGGANQALQRLAIEISEKAHVRVIAQGLSEQLELLTPDGERYRVNKSPITDAQGIVQGVVSVAHNVTAFWQATVMLEKQRQLLSVLHKGLTDYGAMISGDQLWLFLQRALLELTNSQYALIGEVQQHEGIPKLKVNAISDLSWDQASADFVKALRAGERLLNAPDSLLGKAYRYGQVVMIEDVMQHAAQHFPNGHPPLKNYLAVPITDGTTILGMYAIANSDEPYTQALVDWLEPFTSTCSLLIKLHRQIHEQAQTNDALARAHQEAERASQAKTEFLSSMSHELRTPLNAIMGFAQLLAGRHHQAGDARSLRQTEQIIKSGQHLLQLINEVLDLARIESGNLVLSMENIHLKDALQSAAHTLKRMAQRHHVKLAIKSDLGRDIWLFADFTRLRQVLDNLLSNAIKYNRADGEVWIEIAQTHSHVRISICDQGHGIEPSKYALLFKPFNRLGAENGAIEGTGVGLALTKKIIEHMDGEIGFESKPDTGSKFWFELPKGQPVKPNHRPSSAWQPEEFPMSTAIYRVLYVEDNPANLSLMHDIFDELDGFELLMARDGLSGLQQAKEHLPDLIMLDINLPGINGYQTLTLLRAEQSTAKIPVIGLSANAMSRDIQAAKEAGFDLYMTKPLDLNQLFAQLERFKAQSLQDRSAP